MNATDGLASPFTAIKLRCGSCGAPYEGIPTGELLHCNFCGTTQRVVDARQFLDHFRAQVTAFLRQAIPPGLDVSGSSTVDPVARLAVFNSGIRPHLATEGDKYRFGLFNLLSSPYVILPFATTTVAVANANPAAISVFAEKVQAVSGLATDESSRELLRRSGGTASAYQSVLVATGVMRSTGPERLHLLAQDFHTAADAISSTGRWSPVAARLNALSKQAAASDRLLTPSNASSVKESVGEILRELWQARTQISGMPEIGYMVTAVEQELVAARVLFSMARVVEESPHVAPHPLAFLQRLSWTLQWLAQYTPSDWATSFASVKLHEEVMARAIELRLAQAGRGSVKTLAVGSGNLLLPFWVVELPYTFETGVLWAKRGKEVPETLLVASTFPTDTMNLEGTGTRRAVTDVFSVARSGSQSGQLYGRLAGKEQKITESAGLAAVLGGASPAALSGRPAVPPLTTGNEVLKLVQRYLNVVRGTDPKAAAQLRASSPRVVDLVYIPCTVPAPLAIPWLGPLSPASVGSPQSILALVA